MTASDIVTRLRRESFYQPTSRINEFGKPQLGFELTRTNLLAADEIERLRAERDEARRMVCASRSLAGAFEILPSSVAKDLGWDCFKENNT
jgi:predicted acylesterase/phospholipase RssA